MYNHLPRVDPTRSLDGRHRRSENEQAALKRLHREHVAAERADAGERRPAARLPERLVSGPAGAVLALMGVRRARPEAQRLGSTHWRR